MMLENIFPPIPSELIMPFAGFAAAQGALSLPGVIAAGTFGSVLGALPWYYGARWLGAERVKHFADRHGRLLTVNAGDVDRACSWFRRNGRLALLFGRLAPTVRTLISVPGGLAEIPLTPFIIFSAIGTAIWTAVLAIAGYWLGDRYEEASGTINVLAAAVWILAVALYVYRVVNRPGSRAPTPSSGPELHSEIAQARRRDRTD